MNFLYAKSMEELKKCGKLVDIRSQLISILDDNIKIKTRTWKDIYESIQSLRKISNLFSGNIVDVLVSNDLYFKGDAEKLIYILLELDGKLRLDKLGVNKTHFSKKEVADKWRNEILKVIHPDVCKHPQASSAMAELNEMYKEMIK